MSPVTDWRRILALAAFLILVLLLAACSGPDVYEGDIIRGGEQVKVLVRSFVEEVDVEDVVGRLDDQGRAAAQFRLVNDGDEPLRLRIRWSWRDADGFQLRDAAGEVPEQFVVLRPEEEVVFTRTSPTESAVQFVANIRSTASQQD